MMRRNSISHRERIETCISGEAPDRIPVALWRHFPVDDQTPEGLAAATSAYQHLYDFDLIKVSPSSSFCLKDWGVDDRWTGNTEGTREYTQQPVQTPEDWKKLKLLDVSSGHLGAQLECLRLLRREFPTGTPMIQTIFSPLAQAKNLVGKNNLLVHMRQASSALHEGLETITRTTLTFMEEALKTGIDGFYYAVQHAQYGLLSTVEFIEFGKTYDLRLMAVINRAWLNMLHLHGEDVMFDQVCDYPFAIINWHDRQTPPSLVQAKIKFKGVVCGGLSQWKTMTLGTPEQVKAEALEAIRQTGGIRFILGTGCVTPVIAPHGNIMAALQSVRGEF